MVSRAVWQSDAGPATGLAGHCFRATHADRRATGSGKTLAAFLAALDHIWRMPRGPNPKRNRNDARSNPKSVRILYVSPLKALNQDVWQNLQFPLGGILAKSEAIGSPLPALRVAVRSGDTPAHERAAIVRKPPDILITTPESLHLMLTSRAREILRGISHVIIDEIHAVCGNKRGAFLALLLERLQAVADHRLPGSACRRPSGPWMRSLAIWGVLSGLRRIIICAAGPCPGPSRSSMPAGAGTSICK